MHVTDIETGAWIFWEAYFGKIANKLTFVHVEV
jgi:hypothetical protein